MADTGQKSDLVDDPAITDSNCNHKIQHKVPSTPPPTPTHAAAPPSFQTSQQQRAPLLPTASLNTPLYTNTKKLDDPASYYIRSSHACLALCILASAILPFYVYDSPSDFVDDLNAFFFPPLLQNANSNHATPSTSSSSSSSSSSSQKLKSKSGQSVTGGWRPASPEVIARYDSGICSIDKISVTDLTPEYFESDIRYKKPVIVTFPSGASGWTDPRKWSRDALVKEYSDYEVQSGTSLEIVRKGGNGDQSSSLSTFLEKLRGESSDAKDFAESGKTENVGYYMFDRNFYFQSKLPKTLKLPVYFTNNVSEDDSIFFLGASLSGVVFHKHADTWNGVIYGRKRWFLYPTTKTPPGGIYHGFTILDWLSKVYPKLSKDTKPMECVQEAGEILYLPEGTYHATLNLGDTVAFAIQKKQPHLQTEILSYEATELMSQISLDEPTPEDKQNHERLLQIYTELYKHLPENAEVVMKTGEKLYDLERYSDAILWLKRAVEKDPFFVMAHVQLGKAYSQIREYQEAEVHFKKAREISPNLWDVYKEYGEFLLKHGRPEDALPVFKKGTELMPDLVPFWFFYHQCLLQTGNTKEAKVVQDILDKLKANQGL